MRSAFPTTTTITIGFALVATTLTACAGTADVPNLDSGGTAIVCLGDSITYGVGARPEESYPTRLEQRLGVPVVNAGVPGDTAGEGLARLGQALAEDPWLVIVELGGNDVLRRVPVERTERDLRAIVEGVLEAGAVPLLVGLDAGSPVTQGLGDLHARLAEEYGVPVVEGALDDILRDRSLRADMIHPNAAGYEQLAAAVAEAVEPLLEARRERLPEAA